MNHQPKPVLVTTAHRGVFSGLTTADYDGGDNIALTELRMCVFWPVETHGIVGLALTGPTTGSRITPAADAGLLRGVTAVLDLTPKAWAAWQAEPWA